MSESEPDPPRVARKSPYPVEVEAGRTYFWCACGRSQSQPFCDGSHRGTGLTPYRHTPETDGTVFFCGCKATGTPPFCDGSHKEL